MPSSSRQKRPDEIYCRSCGEQIKKQAEICPHCGVRNTKADRSRSGKSSSSKPAHDPSQYETTVGESWYYIVIIPSIFTIPTFALFGFVENSHPVVTLLVMVVFLCAVILPIVGVYFDRQYVRANSRWNPSVLWMVGLFFIYPGNIFLSLLYLYRRREVLGKP